MLVRTLRRCAQIRRAGHSGAMDTPDPEPGILHIDLKGPFPLSVTGKFRYAAFVIDEYSRFVFVEFLQIGSRRSDQAHHSQVQRVGRHTRGRKRYRNLAAKSAPPSPRP